MKNVLIFPAGTEIAFEIKNALVNSKFYNVIGATSVDDHSKYVYKTLINDVPFVGTENFIDVINKIICDYKIDYIYPAHDIVIDYFADNKDKIDAEIISAPYKTVKICRSKQKTYDYLEGEDFVPKYYKDVEDVDFYPVFVKPKEGQGSNGAKIIKTREELEFAINNTTEDLIICEYLSGKEYTVDCFTGLNGELKSAIMRDRARIRTGISVRSTICNIGNYKDIAMIINSRFNFNGAWFFQVKENAKGELKLLEVSPRIPGTMACTRTLGINYPLLTLYNHDGINTDLIINEYGVQLDRAFINRFSITYEYNNIYVDLDDTLIVNGNINYYLIVFLYQCKSKNKKIFLLSRHAKVIDETLNKYAISKNLFDDIYHIKDEKMKSEYIKQEDSIFIDDSFKERKDVHDNCHIPVFDNDSINALIDWRI